MIDKTELLRMIMENNPGQSPKFVLEQFNVYLKGLDDVHAGTFVSAAPEAVDVVEPALVKEPKSSLTCGYTKRNLKVKPETAIRDDVIICCLCEKEGKTLTEKHLATHNGLTREGYIKLCGYPEKQALRSKNSLARIKNNVLKAQLARKAKKRNESVADKWGA